MRINNPKSFLGYKGTPGQESVAYNLTTVGQVKTAINEIDDKFSKLIYGVSGNVIDVTDKGHTRGYAWLVDINGQKKLDPNLLPPLAITNTHVTTSSELRTVAVVTSDDIMVLIDKFLKNSTDTYQEGDILIINPDDGTLPNPVENGAWIITDVPQTGSSAPYKFSRVSYSDKNLVKINGRLPNEIGNIDDFSLADVLSVGQFFSVGSTTKDVLSKNVYRITSRVEGAAGEETNRFGFVDDASNPASPTVVYYAKLSELTETSGALDTKIDLVDTRLDGKIDRAVTELNTRIDDEVTELNTRIDDEVAALDATDLEISGKVDSVRTDLGKPTDAAAGLLTDVNTSLFSQTKRIRQSLINKTTELSGAANYLNYNVNNLATALVNGVSAAVFFFFVTFEWENGEGTDTFFNENTDNYLTTVPGVLGVTEWKHNHAISSDTDDRVLAVFDATGNLVNADIKLVDLGTNDARIQIIVETEYTGNTSGGGRATSLAGETWKLLVAKTIKNVDLKTTESINNYITNVALD